VPLNQKNQTQMKNLFAIVALVGMFSLALASCGGKKDEAKKDSAATKDSVAPEATTTPAEDMPADSTAPEAEETPAN